MGKAALQIKAINYLKTCGVNAADIWKERLRSYRGRSYKYITQNVFLVGNSCSDILMNRFSKKIIDKRALKLIRIYLKSGIMINGIKVSSDETMSTSI